MHETLTISALARRSRVASKALRYWEGLGLLPRAARSRTGYRVFDRESFSYLAFIRKSKAIALTLAEMREILRLARAGHCPCREVVDWSARRMKTVERQIRSLHALLRRLKRIGRQGEKGPCPGDDCGGVCYLVAELPGSRSRGGKNDEKCVVYPDGGSGHSCRDRRPRTRSGVDMLSARLPALPLQVSGKERSQSKG